MKMTSGLRENRETVRQSTFSSKRMRLRRNLLYVLAPLAFVLLAGGFRMAWSQGQRKSVKRPSKVNLEQGQQTFTAKCSACHGLDGRGGERAPNIAGNAMLQRLGDPELISIVTNGIPIMGMPSFQSLGPAGVRAVVGYLRVLQGVKKGPGPPGDAARGKTIFFGKGDCSACHMIGGQGGFAGPDLSMYGIAHPATEIVSAITDPGKKGESGYRRAAATTSDGHRINGIVRNEDNFSVQMQTSDGAFHFFLRADLQGLEYQDHPMMPTDYGERLNGGELNDLTSYLMSTGQGAKPVAPKKEQEEE
jgi:cytochrome c oxidase cbb3-type subunit 3